MKETAFLRLLAVVFLFGVFVAMSRLRLWGDIPSVVSFVLCATGVTLFATGQWQRAASLLRGDQPRKRG
ncbi:MAG TPA: hypothetical protein VMZ51_02810 [Acidimicrobiales bacterium]|nr:hypothetical protein [Acidimicrobiales bacterium]